MQLQRVGLILGLVAWCMQLVVFVQPFLPGHSVPGFGVCQMIIDAFKPAQLLGDTRPQHQNQHTQHQSQQHQARQLEQQQWLAAKQPPHHAQAVSSLLHHAGMSSPHTVDHHFSHLACGFCTLYGHAIPPPEPQPLWSDAAFTVYVTLPRFIYAVAPALSTDYIKPQSRAPPANYIA